MPTTTPRISMAELEGRLLAQREVIIRLLRLMPRDQGGIDWPETVPISDGQEDPGAVPDPAFAIEAARSDELRLIRDAVTGGGT